MIELENYKSNLDIIDKYKIKNIKVNQAVMLTGDTDCINVKFEKYECNSPLLAAAIVGLDNTAAPIPPKSKFLDIWTDIDAQEIFLDTKPTCYLIYGKAGLGAYSLGEALCKRLNCIHLCPKNIINDEIEQGSPTGKTLDFNMRRNKVCTFDVILTLLKVKLKSAAVQHRGYVISDLPLVTCNRNPLYLISSLYSEAAFLDMNELLIDRIYNLKKDKIKKPSEPPRLSQTSELAMPAEEVEEEEEEEEEDPVEDQQAEEIDEEEDEPAELPKFVLDSCSNVIHHRKIYFESKQTVLLQQLQEIFNSCLMPDIIIHINCPEIDLVTKRSRRYINYKTGQPAMDPFITQSLPELRRPCNYRICDYESPHETHIFNPKYYCRSPINFEERVVEQICNYRSHVFPYMQKKIKDFDPKMTIELDGRTTVYQMLHNLTERLILLHIQPVLMPEPLHLTEPPEDMNEFWEIVAKTNVISSGVVNFTRYASSWFNRCPVELKLRRSVTGNPKYAVMFFKHVYLMSSITNFVTFCRNPRPFLKMKYLEPTCRVIVIGTKLSGKTMISQCLSWIFDTPITTYKSFLQTEQKKKYEIFAKNILSEIIATIEDARFLEWQTSELDRISRLNTWCDSTLQLLNDYLPLLVKSIQYKVEMLEEEQHKRNIELDEEELNGEDKVEEDVRAQEGPTLEFLKNFNDLRILLSFLPILDSVEDCKVAVANRNISQYAPIELVTEKIKPLVPVIGDDDVTKAISDYIVANDLQKETEPTTEELMHEIIKFISQIDKNHQTETNFEQSYGKYIIDGFPSDPEYWEHFTDSKLIPDHTIVLIENREMDQELFKYYRNAEKYTKHYDKTILLSKDPLIHTRLQFMSPLHLTDMDMKIITYDIINDVLDLIFIAKQETEDSEINFQAEFITSFTEAVDKFREDWDSVKLKLEDKSKSYTEIELENKTDVEIIEEMLKKLRQSYRSMGELNEDVDEEVPNEDEDNASPKDLLNYNDPQFLCETNIYCPVAFYDYNILWEGKPEFSLKYDNKIHNFCKEEFLEIFRKNITKYQFYNKPHKKLPKLKICVIGCIGSGTTALSKKLAKELGLLHIDFSDIINYYMMPRHYKKVGRDFENEFEDEPLDEEGVVDFQMDEENVNLASEILSNEKEIRRMVYNYFERGTPILPVLMQQMIKKIWFNPFIPTGFVLDGYPKITNDVEDMLASYCIPDIVIELVSSTEVAIDRIAPTMFQKWKTHQNDAKEAAKIRLGKARKEWMHTITKKIVVKLIFEEILETMFFSQTEDGKRLSTGSVIIDAHPSGSANIDPLLFNAYNEMVQLYPEPIDTNVWEKSTDARERLEARIEAIHEIEEENIEALKDIIMEHRIKVVSVDGNKPLNKIFRFSLSKLTNLKNRCESFFEQTFIVNTDIAEMLLIQGFCFLSKFNRLCPVYVYENPQAILNSYKIAKRNGTLFPVVHRSYIYFVCSKDNVTKFRTNPLKYITNDAIKYFIEYPLRIAVIGTPKCGRSELAAKLAKRNGLICLSRGKAIRSVLENMQWTQLASKIMSSLYKGETIDPDLIVKAIQTVALDYRTVTYGFVLDGFPELPYVAKGLTKQGLYPNIVFDISADKHRVLEHAQNEIYYDILKYWPPLPIELMEKKYEAWRLRHKNIRIWIAEDYQNLSLIDGNQSRWKILQDVNGELMKLTSKIHYYVSNVNKKIVLAMWISNETFEQRQTQYKTLCPVCFHKKIYRHSGYPYDKRGIVQYQNKFYWVCEEHLDIVMTYPHCFLTYNVTIEIPEIPVVVTRVNIQNIYENGICIVTYAENLPAHKITMGTYEFAACYANKTYLFCKEKCLHKFLDRPHLFYDITVFKAPIAFPRLCLKKLPDIGYLEQTLGYLLTESCCSVNVLRPKYPGLTFQLSALIHIALYLKTHNPLWDETKKNCYHRALKIFEARCKLMLNVGLRLRSMDNPFANYPQCHHKAPTLIPEAIDYFLSSFRIQTLSTVSHRASTYVHIHKNSSIHQQRTSKISGYMKRY